MNFDAWLKSCHPSGLSNQKTQGTRLHMATALWVFTQRDEDSPMTNYIVWCLGRVRIADAQDLDGPLAEGRLHSPPPESSLSFTKSIHIIDYNLKSF